MNDINPNFMIARHIYIYNIFSNHDLEFEYKTTTYLEGDRSNGLNITIGKSLLVNSEILQMAIGLVLLVNYIKSYLQITNI